MPLPEAALLVDGPAAFDETLLSLQSEDALLVVHLWATWCPPCAEEFVALAPELDRAIRAGTRVALFSLDEPESREEAVPAFLAAYGVPGRSYLLNHASPEEIAQRLDPSWPAGALPATFVFKGKTLLKAFHGPVTPEALRGALSKGRAAR